MAVQSRRDEIKEIHIAYKDFYQIGGGLFLILVLVIIGSWIFGQNAFELEGDFLGYVTNVAMEFLSVVGTVIVVDQLNRWRARDERKKELFRQVKSRWNDVAVEALDQIWHESWFEEMVEYYRDGGFVDLDRVQWAGGVDLSSVDLKKGHLRRANLQEADLRGVNLQEADLVEANLQEAFLFRANLQEADLWKANLQEANLWVANLQEADLVLANLEEAILFEANLQEADLRKANLQWADLRRANLQEANLVEANLQGAWLRGAILPDGTKWRRWTDMERFTNPEHPEFWKPD